MNGQTERTRRPRRLSFLAACAALGVIATAHADDDKTQTLTDRNTSPPIQQASYSIQPRVSLVAGFYYPSEFCPEPKFGAELDVPDVALLYTPGVSPFSIASHETPLAITPTQLKQTDNFIDRLADLEKLEILPLLRTTSASVYFGINREGRLGMHLNSRD